MRTRFHRCQTACAALLVVLTLTARSQETLPVHTDRAQQTLDRQAPVFIENRGQWDPQAKFLLRSSAMDMWITDHGVVYDLNRVEYLDALGSTETTMRRDASDFKRIVHHAAVFMTFLGARDDVRAHGGERAEGYHNYFIGNDPSNWAANVPLYSEARIENLYSGIDAVFYLDNVRPRYDLVVAPGADVKQVQMQFQGAEQLRIDENGSLVIRTSLGEIRQRELFAYQMCGGERQQVHCGFHRVKDGVVRFDVGSYDRTRVLVIDPVTIAYSTFFGSSDEDYGWDIAVDASGNAYVTGETNSPVFPTLNPAQSSFAGSWDTFIAKLTSSGTLVYSTYLGGNNDDGGYGIGGIEFALDAGINEGTMRLSSLASDG